MQTLASDKFEGRLTGSAGERLAGDYLIAELKRMGAKPLPGMTDFRMPFTFTAGSKDGGSKFTINRVGDGSVATTGSPRLAAREFSGSGSVQALSFSDAGEVSGAAVFAGYGLVVPNSQDFGYDSYQGLDVKDKIVVVLRYFPEDADQKTRAILARYADLRYKAQAARQRGAKGMIVVTGPRSPNAGMLVPMSFDTAIAGSGIVALTHQRRRRGAAVHGGEQATRGGAEGAGWRQSARRRVRHPRSAVASQRADRARAADRQQRRRLPAGDDGDDRRQQAVGRGRRALRSPRAAAARAIRSPTSRTRTRSTTARTTTRPARRRC